MTNCKFVIGSDRLVHIHVSTQREGISRILVSVVRNDTIRRKITIRCHHAHLFISVAQADVVVLFETGLVEITQVVLHVRIRFSHRPFPDSRIPIHESHSLNHQNTPLHTFRHKDIFYVLDMKTVRFPYSKPYGFQFKTVRFSYREHKMKPIDSPN